MFLCGLKYGTINIGFSIGHAFAITARVAMNKFTYEQVWVYIYLGIQLGNTARMTI